MTEHEWLLDLQYGPWEHHRRQMYSISTTELQGTEIALVSVLEWPKMRSSDPDADAVGARWLW